MSIYDCIPVEPHGMSEWTLFVFIGASIAAGIAVKLFDNWKIEHDKKMKNQIQRIDEHDRRLSDASTDMAVMKADLSYIKQSLDELKTPLENVAKLTERVFEKVLNDK